ncbi:MAG: 2-C-methyl-D-erythritol 2,4-cyclodiphosphate synthase, partial [Pseudomonas caspiana]
LGGERNAHTSGLLEHSDGDLVLHALSYALLGAAALGDIGKHFPDTDPQFKGADSRVLLRHVLKQVQAKGWKVGNVDATIVAQAPKMAPHIESMRALIAEDLQVDIDQINVKATTTEKLGFTGREEGIAVHAVALLISA